MSKAQTLRSSLLRSALIGILPAAVMTGVAAACLSYCLGFDAVYPEKALAVFAAGAVLVLIGLPKHHPFAAFGAANRVTVGRGALVALLAALIGERAGTGVPLFATAAAIIVAVLDGVDGWLARRHRMTSDFGARFDMETDALFIMVLAVLAWQFQKTGAWVLLSGALRYAFVGAGVVMPWLRRPLIHSARRKTVAVVQVVALILSIAPFVSTPVAACVAAVGLCALTWSFALDIVWLFQNMARSGAVVSQP